MLDAVAQEIDIPTGLVLFQWDSLDHVPVTRPAIQPAPTARPPVGLLPHQLRSQQAADGSILISARNTWAVYDVSHQTGAINWTLGGKASSFKMGPRHAVRLPARRPHLSAPTQITIFDDGAGPPVVHKQSRGITLRLDFATTGRRSLLLQDEHQPGLLAAYEGSVQPHGQRR